MPPSMQLILYAGLCFTGWLTVPGADQPPPANEPALDQLVTAYFSSEKPQRRAELVEEIRARSVDDWNAVAQVLPDLELWLPEANRTGVFSAQRRGHKPIPIRFELPEGYDARIAHPVILCVAGRSQSPASCIRDARTLFGAGTRGFIFVSSNQIIDRSFHQSSTSDRTLDVVRAVRRRFHSDTDRWFVYGSGAGADAAWMAVTTHPDLFAGFVSIDGYLNAPYPDEMYRLWLPSLRQVRGYVAYRNVEEPIRMIRAGRVHVHNQVIATIAHALSIPLYVGALGSTGELDDIRLAEVLSARSSPDGGETTHWFRYPWQGAAGWLRQTKFGGEVWTADQLSIFASPSADSSGYISSVLKNHLAYVGGRVDGQVIRIETRRCREIEVRLTPSMVDLDKPITIYCNNKRRHRGLVPQSIETLLTCAREDWAFQHPVAATIRISIRSDAKQASPMSQPRP